MFWRNCCPMNAAPISVPKTMIPAHAATQNTRPTGDPQVVQRVAAACRWRITNATPAASAIAERPSTSDVSFGMERS